MLRYLSAFNMVAHPDHVRLQYPSVVTAHTAVTEVTNWKEKSEKKKP